MKRSIWVRLIAMILVISMLAAPVSAATVRGSGHSTNGLIGAIIGIIKDIIKDIIDDWFDIPGVGDPDPTEPPVPTTPEEPTDPAEPEPSEPAVTDPTVPSVPEQTDPTDPSEPEEEAPEYELNLVEGHANTVNGNLLRGVTYSLSQLVAQEPQTAPYALRSTGYALNAVAEETTSISDTALVITYDENGNAVIENGQYALGIVGGKYVTNVSANSDGLDTLSGTSSKDSATIWTITRQADGSYTVQDPNNEYLSVPSWREARMSATPVYLSIHQDGSNTVLKQPKTRDEDRDEFCYLNALDGITSSSFGGWTEGSPICLYALTTTEPEQPDTNLDLIYFPVTMFNYDEDVIRRLTNQAEVEAGLKETWEGLYFSGGSPSATEYTYSTGAVAHSDLNWQQVMDGTYYADEACTKQVTVEAVGDGGSGWNAVTLTAANDAYVQYPQYADGNYYYKNGDNYEVIVELSSGWGGWYIYYGEGGWDDYANVAGYELTIYTRGGETTGYTLTAGDETLATLDNTDLTAKVDMTLYTPADETTVTKPYAAWNWWSYKPANNNSDNAQNKFYAGLVQDELVNGEIKFNVVEPGIFTFDPDHPEITKDEVKDIYQNVGLPFVIEDGFYTFDSDAHGTYFADNDDADNKSNPGHGTSDEYFNLYFDQDNTQGWSGMETQFGDGSYNLWAPFNTNANDNYAGEIDYHFGMRADIPFSMTPNGCIKSTDDNSPPIEFRFQGDDDVWIFIDGHLVIDLGGIHNRLGAKINFADNTITYYLPESNHNANPFGAFNLEGFELVQKLYDDASGEGALGQTRPDFSSQEEHKMTIFYLERGMGTSNCKIQFNLPMRDTLMVTKDASMSWSEKQDENDGDHDGTAPLTSSEQAAVDNIPFGFTLYKKEANATDFTPVANTNYFLQDQNGVVQYTDHTDANGHFYLKNGETAKFMTDFPKEGVTYYVVEDKTPDGFLTPDFQFKGKATNGFDWYNAEGVKQNQDPISDASVIDEQEIPMDWTGENKSYTLTAYGSMESIDSLEFICVNYMNAELPNPTALAYEDMIVIDYGLPVQIDPLANDLFRGDKIEIVAWGDESLTLNAVDDGYGNHVAHDDANAQNKTTWSGGKEFHSGNVTFNDVTYSETTVEGKTVYTRDTFEYKLNKQLTEVEVISYIIKVTSSLKTEVTHETKTACRYALAKVYIAPATIMYYEENFSDMILFEGAGWTSADDPKNITNATNVSPFQEPGVVGTNGDSTYGSDLAYLRDNGDSNGTSRFGDTSTKAIRFTYTFTGTGSTIFARTSDKTGYMQVKLYRLDEKGNVLLDENGNEILEDLYYRDTYWKDENETTLDSSGTLYNIPVYSTNENLDYGTYKVVCTIAKAGTYTAGNDNGAGNEFYLDGIRVMQPLNEMAKRDDLVEKALEAYTIDGESNLDVVTLRQKLITDAENGEAVWNGTDFVVLTDINDTIVTAAEYTSIGPKEEVYLMPGQKVTFSLKYWEPEGLKLYAGMKAPFGSALVKVGHDVYDLKNAADCYYDVTDNSASLVEKYEQLCNGAGQPLFNDPEDKEVYLAEDGSFYYTKGNALVPEDTELTPKDDPDQPYYVVTYTFEATDKIVSLTNIKVVGSHEFTIIENTDINQ